MKLPPVDSDGNLPVGIHSAALHEVCEAFGYQNRTRELMFTRLERIAKIIRQTGHLARMIVYGSFVTSKPEPNDIDIFLVFDENFDASACDAETLL